MLKIITSVVLTLVTIMAVTLFAVTVPAQSAKIEEIKTAIEKNTEYIQDVEDFAYTVDGITDGLNTRLETLEDKKIYAHYITIYNSVSAGIYRVTATIVNNTNVQFNITSLNNYLTYNSNVNQLISCNGTFIRASDSKVFNIIGLCRGTTSPAAVYLDDDGATTTRSLSGTFVDYVYTI